MVGLLAYSPTAAAQAMQPGVNLSGLETNPGHLPGKSGRDYAVPTDGEFAYYASKGIHLVRLPILWERLQPAALTDRHHARLNAGYLATVQSVIRTAASHGTCVILDLHNYGGFGGHKLGDGVLTADVFAAFWQSAAAAFGGMPGLCAYDLMNEPEGLPNATVWPAAAQAAVTALRRSDMTTPVLVEGDNWSSAGDWPQVNGALSINDPAGLITYEAHVYGDRDNSGTHFIWAEEQAAGVTVDTIADRIAPFATWCSSRGVACMIGEVGVGNDDPAWNSELANGLAAAQAGGLTAFTYWAGGPWWGGYPLSIEPAGGADAPQMSVVSAYAPS